MEIVDVLATADTDELRAAATCATDLADWREQTTKPKPDTDPDREVDNSQDE